MIHAAKRFLLDKGLLAVGIIRIVAANVGPLVKTGLV
jgi:hypothetical protein